MRSMNVRGALFRRAKLQVHGAIGLLGLKPELHLAVVGDLQSLVGMRPSAWILRVYDVSNLNKLIDFFEAVGAIKIKSKTVSGRAVKTPIVEYEQIEFDLKVA